MALPLVHIVLIHMHFLINIDLFDFVTGFVNLYFDLYFVRCRFCGSLYQQPPVGVSSNDGNCQEPFKRHHDQNSDDPVMELFVVRYTGALCLQIGHHTDKYPHYAKIYITVHR